MADADGTDNNPSTEFTHSSAPLRPRQAVAITRLCKFFENSLPKRVAEFQPTFFPQKRRGRIECAPFFALKLKTDD
jgi:hypothetical protein